MKDERILKQPESKTSSKKEVRQPNTFHVCTCAHRGGSGCSHGQCCCEKKS